jgi:hypothetical protein
VADDRMVVTHGGFMFFSLMLGHYSNIYLIYYISKNISNKQKISIYILYIPNISIYQYQYQYIYICASGFGRPGFALIISNHHVILAQVP